MALSKKGVREETRFSYKFLACPWLQLEVRVEGFHVGFPLLTPQSRVRLRSMISHPSTVNARVLQFVKKPGCPNPLAGLTGDFSVSEAWA